VILGTFDGKTYHGEGFICRIERYAEGRIQIYVSRDDISDDEEK
jgi:hypothetical protein